MLNKPWFSAKNGLLSENHVSTGEIYNISDDKPASMEEVTLYGVKLLNVDIPKIIEVKDIGSEMLKSFYKDSKKVNNKKINSKIQVTMIHGRKDEVVPVVYSKKILSLFNKAKKKINNF